MELTKEQEQAIAEQGRVIVSASAGSGKTFVMIERLVRLILAGGSVENVLAVTFTNKAASQMRERLRTAVLKKIGETAGEERARLKEQLALLPLADISTIHAFCARLARTNFFAAGVDPSFRIVSSDDAEGKALIARALNEAFERAYEEGGESFKRLLSVYFRKKKDKFLRELVLSLYENVADTEDEQAALLRARDADMFDEACGYLYGDYRARAQFLSDAAEDMGAFFAEHSRRAFDMCAQLMAAAKNLLDGEDLFSMVQRAAVTPPISATPGKTKAAGEELRFLERLSATSKAVKKLYTDLRGIGDRETERTRCDDANSRAYALCTLTLSFCESYARLKQEAGVLDYSDLERAALKALSREEVVSALKEKYRYVFVDEYQDVNPVQEKILSLISGENVFLVGDEKQAIYGFRGSRSEFFEEKANSLDKSLRLTVNFRSSGEVLEAVNRVFCGIAKNYVPMRGGERYGDHKGKVRFHYVAEEKKKREEPHIYSVLSGARSAEENETAEAVENIVRAELGAPWFDADTGEEKRITYGDIAVLVRKNTGDAERIVRLFSERNIPVTTSSKVNVCDHFEARLLIDWLSYLDNPEQDIPFAGALLSAVGGFTESELAKIRLAPETQKAFTFRKACALYCGKKRDEIAHKLLGFCANAGRFRAFSRVRTAAEMMNLLLSEGLEAQICAKGESKNRLARVRRLIAEGEDRSTHEFLRRLNDSGGKIDFSEAGGEDAVKVFTMHASKGLEYPVVILANLDTLFRGGEREEVMWTEKFFSAPKCYDTQNKLVYETLVRRASSVYGERRDVKEERNLLYVAMTRAKFRLHLLFKGQEQALSPDYAKRFSDYFDFSRCADYWEEETPLPPPAGRKMLEYREDGETVKKILSVYNKPYAYEASVKLPMKSSATEIMRERMQEDDLHARFLGASPNAREEGIAYHAFLQHVAFGKPARQELARMREEGVLTEEQLSLLREEKLEEILAIPCLKGLAGKRVYREQTFLLSLPANEIENTAAQDEIVYQGAIDLLCEDESGYTVIDYKYSAADDRYIKEHYAPQIALYKKAVARIMRVAERTVRARIVNILQGNELPM